MPADILQALARQEGAVETVLNWRACVPFEQSANCE